MKYYKNPKVLVLVDQAIFSGTSFLLTVLLARYLSVSEFGSYSGVILMIYLAINAIGAWTVQVFQVASNRSSEYISFLFFVQGILSLVIGFATAIICHAISIDYYIGAIVFGLGFMTYDFFRKIFFVLDHIVEVLILDVIASISVLFSYFLFTYQGIHTVDDLMMYMSSAYLITLGYALWVVRPFTIDVSQIKDHFTAHLSQGKWLFMTALSQWWAGNLFVVASGWYLGVSALGALRLGQSLFGVLNVLLQVYENYVLPQSAFIMQRSQQLGITYLRQMNQKLAKVFIPILLMTFVYAEPILTLVGGHEYTSYGFVLRGLCIVYLLILLGQPLRFFFRSQQMNNHFFFAYLISLVVALITSHWLITKYSLQGVIAGLVISQVVLMGYWHIILQIKNINIWKSSTSY